MKTRRATNCYQPRVVARSCLFLITFALSTCCALWEPCGALAQQDECDADDSFCSATQLTGDWFGRRSLLADNGVSFYADNTSFLFGNATGGVANALDYSGHGDYILLLDGAKLGIRDGFSLKIRAEHRFGQTVVNNVGCFISPTLLSDLPVFNSDQLYLTNFLLTQKLNDSVAVFAGKMDTLDGDMNAFAHARGKTQFSNMAFIFNPIVGATVPYSTDTTNTSGFSQLFSDGLLLSTAVRLPTTFFGRPGHHLFGGTWNNQLYTSIREAYIEYPDVTIPTTRGSWCLYWNFDQYLVQYAEDPQRGWGAFGRAGIADPNTSPLAWFLSYGIGGDSPLASRPDDTFGVGWYYAGMSHLIGDRITSQIGPVRSGQGVECYYNYELTPAIRLTPDLQVIVPSIRDLGTALILGLRAQLVF